MPFCSGAYGELIYKAYIGMKMDFGQAAVHIIKRNFIFEVCCRREILWEHNWCNILQL